MNSNLTFNSDHFIDKYNGAVGRPIYDFLLLLLLLFIYYSDMFQSMNT